MRLAKFHPPAVYVTAGPVADAWHRDRDVIPGVEAMNIGRTWGALPAGATSVAWDWVPRVTSDEIRSARAHFERLASDADPLTRDRAVAALASSEALYAATSVAKGEPHPWAWQAADRHASVDSAAREYAEALLVWNSLCSTGVVRVSTRGWQVFRGVGSFLESVGHVAEPDDAVGASLGAVMSYRVEACAGIRKILRGWNPGTPYYTATLRTIEDLPIAILAGPMDAGTVGTSWDLPVYARVRGGVVERSPEVITWDAAAQRQAHRARS